MKIFISITFSSFCDADFESFLSINRLGVAVYYDDMFKEEFGDTVNTRIEAIMAIVDEMYSEKNTLTTEFEVTTIALEHSRGSNWGMVNDWGRELVQI